MIEFEITKIEQLKEVASTILKYTDEYKIVCFYGRMGVGKTTLIKKICEELEIIDTVNSPTFSIVNEYNNISGQQIFHFDCYRLDNINQALDIGFHEYIESGNICLIEWPEKISMLLPHSILKVELLETSNFYRNIKIFVPSYEKE